MRTKLTLLAFISFLAGEQLNSAHDFTVREIDPISRSFFARRVFGEEYQLIAGDNLQSKKLESFIYSKMKSALIERSNLEIHTVVNTLIEDSSRYGFDPLFIMAIAQQESGIRPTARGRHGEIGLMQILPQTARWIGKKYGLPFKSGNELLNPVKNLQIGIRYLAWLRQQFDDPRHTTSAYNMGPANLRRILAQQKIPAIYYSGVFAKYKKLYLELHRSISGPSQVVASN